MKFCTQQFLLIATLGLTFFHSASAQDELLDIIAEEEEPQYTTSTFSGSRLILGHSIETHHKKTLEFLIIHRFGRINTGAHNLFGLDDAQIRLGLDYGLTDNLNIGLGRSSYDKTIDGFLKYRLLRQAEDRSPVTLTLFSSLAVKTTPTTDDDPSYAFVDRLAFVHQALVARKINSNFSLQFMPTVIHRNRVEAWDDNTQTALGVGGKINLTKGLALNAEYYYRVDPPEDTRFKNSLSVGFDIETGGHIFQLHFTNSVMTVERAFITETEDDFFDGDIHFGFNISRVFQLGKDKEKW